MRQMLIWLVLLLAALAACGGGEESADTSAPTERSEPTAVPTPPDDPTETTETSVDLEQLDPEARAIVEAAIDDLASRTGAAAGDIQLVSFQYVTWNDGSLGCPQPGEMYTQALVDGSRTVLEADGTTYSYHAGQDGDPFLCENPSLESGTVPSREK